MYSNVLPAPPTNHRLPIAMGISTAIVMVILALDVDWRIELIETTGGQRLPLMITIKKAEPVVDTPRPMPITPVEISRQPRAKLYDEPISAPIEPEPARDWETIAEDFSEQHVATLEAREDALATMFQKSPSIMFEAENEFGIVEEGQIMADLDFAEPVGVIGLGFTIGSCFIGLPLAGIPVEERSPAITLWHCRY